MAVGGSVGACNLAVWAVPVMPAISKGGADKHGLMPFLC